MKKLMPYIAGLIIASLFSCRSGTKQSEVSSEIQPVVLDSVLGRHILTLPLHCVNVEYPNKLGQVLGSSADLKGPYDLHPIFYGCFDWHSSVHGYWSIVRLLKDFPDLDQDGKIFELLDAKFTAANVLRELAFFQDENNKTFERTYGWVWVFQLQKELLTWDNPTAKKWAKNFDPLVKHLIAIYTDYLPKLVYPIRSGQHDNSAFSFSLAIEYARTAGNVAFEKTLTTNALRLFNTDRHCDMAFEPSGSDFLSPCLEEALCMSYVMNTDNYRAWLKNFMPDLFSQHFRLEPAIVKDRTDGKLVHLDGLNYSRATCLYGISKALPELNDLREVADKHLRFSLPNLSTQDDYMGSHWLGTFALYALIHSH